MAHLTGNSGEQLRSGQLNYIKISIVVVHVLCLASLSVACPKWWQRRALVRLS